MFFIVAVDGGWYATEYTQSRLRRAGWSAANAERLCDGGLNAPRPLLLGAVLGRWGFHRGRPDPNSEAGVLTHDLRSVAGVIIYRSIEHELSHFRLDAFLDATGLEFALEYEERVHDLPGETNGMAHTWQSWMAVASDQLGFIGTCELLLTPNLARGIMQHGWHTLHVAAFCAGQVPWRRIPSQWAPSQAHILGFARSLDVPHAAPRGRAPRQVRKVLEELPPAIMIEWIDATSECIQLRRAHLALEKWGKIISRHSGLNLSRLTAGIKKAPYTQLRKGRIKLDAVVMLLWRRFFERTVLTSLSIHLWLDASPQRRGVEFLAASMRVCKRHSVLFRRKLTAISLARSLRGVVGKTLGLLWQLFLYIGPRFHRMRAVLNQVYSLTTDMGQESEIYRSPDILIDFFNHLQIHVPKDSPRQKWLLPNCAQLGGWRHKVDIWIKRPLGQLRWFPAWLKNCRALVAFLRDESMREDLVADLQTRGLTWVAHMMEAPVGIRFAAIPPQNQPPSFPHTACSSNPPYQIDVFFAKCAFGRIAGCIIFDLILSVRVSVQGNLQLQR